MRTLPLIALGLCCLTVPAQQLTVLLDPARGGTEDGARIDEHTAEKQVTLDLAARLRALLNARDFNVVATRDGDVTVTNDARAALANQSKPIACLLLHATAAGKGLHLFTSALPQSAPGLVAIQWDEAQAPFAQRSERLEGELSTAFGRSNLAVSSGHTWVRPLDNMQCPAVAIEIAPDGDGRTAADRGYQNRIAEAIAGALLFWRGHADVVQSMVPAADAKPAAPSAATAPAGTVGSPAGGAAVTKAPVAGTGGAPGKVVAARTPERAAAPGTSPTPGTTTPRVPVTTAPAATRVPALPAPRATGTQARPAATPGNTDPNSIAPATATPARPTPKVARPQPVPARPAEGSPQ